MTSTSTLLFDVCILSHGNWTETERALKSAWRLGLHVHLGLTVEEECPFSSPLLNVYRVDWSADFAAARNVLLDQVNSERPYLLWIDSDDEILCCPSEAPKDQTTLIFDIKKIEYAGFTAGRRTTVHRNDPSIRWTGSIHERLALVSGAPIPPIGHFSGLAVLHHGYEEEDVAMAKLLRNAMISADALAGGCDYPGALVSMARLRAAQGDATAFDWLSVYKSTEAYARKHGYPLDQCWEAAAALAYCGFARPAERHSARNPLNLPLQLSLLISHRARTGILDELRFDFVLLCLQRILWDDRFPFDRNLVCATRQQFANYIDAEVERLGWHGYRNSPGCRNVPMTISKIFIQCKDIMAESFEDDTLLLTPLTNRVVSLNATAKIFWDAMEAGVSVEDCVEMLREARGEPLEDDAIASIQAFFQELLDAGLIRGS